jgi:hypothetical protein
VPHDEVEQVKAACDSLRRDIARANDNLALATKSKNDAVKARDSAVEAQHAAEQAEKQAKNHLEAEYMKLIDPVVTALKALTSASLDARERRYQFDCLLTEFRRMHALALVAPVNRAPTPPVKVVRQATAEELATAREALIEQARIENAAQPRSVDPSAYEPMRERAIPRTPEPEPVKPISGGADFEPWVK